MSAKFEFVREKLRTSGKQSIVALHKFVFESEGDRSNRKRLREFEGFEYDEHDDRCKQKFKYIGENLTATDLISICNVLGLSFKVENVGLHIFRNLQNKTLLCAAAEAGENDDDDDESESGENGDDGGDDMRSFDVVTTNNAHFGFPPRASSQVSINDRINNESDEQLEAMSRGATTTKPFAEAAQVTRFSINFRDIEDSYPVYTLLENGFNAYVLFETTFINRVLMRIRKMYRIHSNRLFKAL